MVIVTSPKQVIIDKEVTVPGPNKAVKGTGFLALEKKNEIVTTEDKVFVVWRQLFARKDMTDAEKNRRKDFVATVRGGVALTTGVVMQNIDAMSSFEHVDKINPATSAGVVSQNGGATSSFKHVDRICLVTGAGVVAQNDGATTSFKHVGKYVPRQVQGLS